MQKNPLKKQMLRSVKLDAYIEIVKFRIKIILSRLWKFTNSNQKKYIDLEDNSESVATSISDNSDDDIYDENGETVGEDHVVQRCTKNIILQNSRRLK